MTASWGQTVVIENRPGADTTIGAEVVAKADPDGYTLLAAMDSTMVLNPLVKKDLPYDPARDFEPISLGAKNISVLEVRGDSTAHTVQDLIDTLKARPGKLNFGTGTTNGRLAALLFAKLTGTNFAIIPYKGSAETVEGLLTGSVDFGIDGMASSYPLIKDGKFRALAKLSDRPLAPTARPAAARRGRGRAGARRHLDLDRVLRAGRHVERNHRQAVAFHRHHLCRPRRRQAAARRRHHRGVEHARRAQDVRAQRNRALGQGHSRQRQLHL